MSVEILSVSLSDESIERLAAVLAARLTAQQSGAQYVPSTTDSNPPSPQPPQDAEGPGFQQQADPWETATPTPPAGQQSQPPVQQGQPQQYQNQRRAPAAPGTLPSGTPPACQHGVMQPIPAGVSQAGKPYGPGWGCTAPRGQQCRPVWSR